MTQILRELSLLNSSLQNMVNFTALLLTIMLVGYFVLTGVEQAEILRAV